MRFWPLLVVSTGLFLAGCGKEPPQEPAATTVSKTVPTIVALYPSGTSAGKAFNVQPDGSAALGIACKDVTPGRVAILFGSTRLAAVGDTTPGKCSVSTTVPKELITTPGTYPVILSAANGDSAPVNFVVGPAEGAKK